MWIVMWPMCVSPYVSSAKSITWRMSVTTSRWAWELSAMPSTSQQAVVWPFDPYCVGTVTGVTKPSHTMPSPSSSISSGTR